MNIRTESGKVSSLTVVIVIVVLAIAGIFVIPAITNGDVTGRLKDEINRIADESSIKPYSVECRNVESANICYATYKATSSSMKRMLSSSGYDTHNSDKDSISGTNESTKVRVDSESSASQQDVTLKFKDINVTL